MKGYIVAGCCNTIEVGTKNVWVHTTDNKRHIFGKLVSTTDKSIKSKVKAGDIAFGCCHDCIIRGNTIYEVIKPDWFFGKSIDNKFESDRQYVFSGKFPSREILPEDFVPEYEVVK